MITKSFSIWYDSKRYQENKLYQSNRFNSSRIEKRYSIQSMNYFVYSYNSIEYESIHIRKFKKR